MKRIVSAIVLFSALLLGSLSAFAGGSEAPVAPVTAPPLESVLAPEGSCSARAGDSTLAFLEPAPTALACMPAACRAECRAECKAIGCFPDCILSTCECYCNC